MAIHYFHSGMQGAPSITGAAGALIGLLDAVLVDGFGQLSVTSLVVASGVATMTFSGGHSYAKHSVLAVAGATPGALNGNKKLLSVSGTSLTFAAAGVPDGAATGTITAKVAPLGWEKRFAGADVAAYRSLDVQSLGMLLRVDDTSTTQVRVRGYEAMSDVDTGTGPFPTVAQQSGAGGWWPKSYQAGGAARGWVVVGDSRAFYLCINTGANPYSGWAVYFGDFVAENSTDAYACGLRAGSSDMNNYGSETSLSGDVAITSQSVTNSSWGAYGLVCPRDYHGLGAAVTNGTWAELSYSNSESGRGNWAWPNPISNRLFTSRVMVTSAGNRRGYMPGLWHTPQNLVSSGAIQTRDELSDLDGQLAGRTLVALRTGYQYTASLSGGMLFFLDVTGPWR